MQIAVAMSGGRNSSLAAAILKKSGYEVIGITCKLIYPEDIITLSNDDEKIISAKRIARQYEFRHKTLFIEKTYTQEFIDYLYNEYQKGKTPPPALILNTELIFKRILEYVKANGYAKLAIGYYARLTRTGEGRYFISTGIDKRIDQSYYLSLLPQEMLEYIVLPLGEYHMDAARRLEHQIGIPYIDQEDESAYSQLNENVNRILKNLSDKNNQPGKIVDLNGIKIGTHNGIYKYVIGQECPIKDSTGKQLYVLKKEINKNIITAGREKDLYINGLYVKDIRYMRETSLDEKEVYIRINEAREPVKAKLSGKKNGIKVYFEESQAHVTPGEIAVFYNWSGHILGSGRIEYAF